MESSHGTGQLGGALSMAVDRLDRALAALEARAQALNDGEPLPEYTPPASEGSNAEYQRVLDELDAVRREKDALAAVANTAFDALGTAASNIRVLLREEAA
jgi:hypothetical protein